MCKVDSSRLHRRRSLGFVNAISYSCLSNFMKMAAILIFSVFVNARPTSLNQFQAIVCMTFIYVRALSRKP